MRSCPVGRVQPGTGVGVLTDTQKKACDSGVSVGVGRSVGVNVGLGLGANVGIRVGVAADGNVPQAAKRINIKILIA